MTPNMTFTSCPNRKSKFNIKKKNHIGTTTRGKFKMFWTIVQIVNCQKIFMQEGDPNFTFTSCPNRKSKFNILKNHLSTTASGKFTICALLYRSLILKKYLQEGDPNLTFTSFSNQKSKFNIKKNHISTTTRGKFKTLWTIVQIVNCYKIFTRRWPQFDLYFLTKPEVKVYY